VAWLIVVYSPFMIGKQRELPSIVAMLKQWKALRRKGGH
jgi:hypothetical protein